MDQETETFLAALRAAYEDGDQAEINTLMTDYYEHVYPERAE